MMPTAVPLAPSSARYGPVIPRMPSYAASAKRLTMPKATMKARPDCLWNARGVMRRAAAERKRRVNATAGERRYQSGGIADQHHAAAAQRRDGSAGGNQSAAPRGDVKVLQSESLLDAVDQQREIGFVGPSRGNPDLRHATTRHNPSDVTRRKLAVGKAMEETRIDLHNRLAFDLSADKKAAVPAQSENICDARARAIGTDEKARCR